MCEGFLQSPSSFLQEVSESVPQHVWSQHNFRVNPKTEMVSALERQDTPPYNIEKSFLVETVVMSTRLLETKSLDDSVSWLELVEI